MRVGIASPQIAPRDAVANDVLGMCSVLRELATEVRVFSERSLIDSLQVERPERMAGFLASPSDLLIYHHSIQWDQGLESLQAVRSRRVVKYHNITPPGFFRGLAENYTTGCERGREQLTQLADLDLDLYLADSAYNLSELRELGAGHSNGRIVPPFHHTGNLRELDLDQALLYRLRNGRTNLLAVGRIAPNKGYGALVETFAAYFHGFNQNSRLLIVGKEDLVLRLYGDTLRRLAARLGVAEHVEFLGEVDNSTLATLYAVADVFMTTSLHEGFCVPLVEAMAQKIPIAAFGLAAVPETAGSAGIVWREQDPVLLAATVDRIVRDPKLRSRLGENGERRYQEHFTNERIRQKFLGALQEFAILPPPATEG